MGRGSEVGGQRAEVRTAKRGRAPTPAQIFAKIEAQPPLMRQQAAGAYIGKEVHWALTFSNGSESRPGEAWLIFRFDSHDLKMVTGCALLSDYPSLRVIRPGETVLVHGRIKKIDELGLSIELEIQDLVFAKATEAAHCPPRRS